MPRKLVEHRRTFTTAAEKRYVGRTGRTKSTRRHEKIITSVAGRQAVLSEKNGGKKRWDPDLRQEAHIEKCGRSKQE